MKKSLKLSKYPSIGLDTNIFIYYLTRNSPFYPLANELFKTIESKGIEITTSTITLIEILSFKIPQSDISNLEKEFLLLPKLRMIAPDIEIAKVAAKIRREYGFGLADSIQLATALKSGAKVFITNDAGIKKFKELKVVLLNKL